MKFERDDPTYVSTLRTSAATPAGSFSFPRMADGVWYVTEHREVGGSHSRVEGRSMTQRVDVRGGTAGEGDAAVSGY